MMPTGRIIPTTTHQRKPELFHGRFAHLDEVLEVFPDKQVVIYNRASSDKQAKEGRLLDKTRALSKTVRARLNAMKSRREVIGRFEGVELGQVDAKRPTLAKAAAFAKEQGAILVTFSWDRFFRSECYDKEDKSTFDIPPTTDELAKLDTLTQGVVLATYHHPSITEMELHGEKIKKSGKAGRPSSLTYEKVEGIFKALGFRKPTDDHDRITRKWCTEIKVVAARFGVSEKTINNLLNEPTPNPAALKADRWIDLKHDLLAALLMCVKNGWIDPTAPWKRGNGKISSSEGDM